MSTFDFIDRTDNLIMGNLLKKKKEQAPSVEVLSIQKRMSIFHPGTSIYNPGMSIHNPGMSIHNPGMSIHNPGTSIYNPGTSIIPFSISSLDEYAKNELGSIISTSSCTRPSVFNSEENDNSSSENEVEETESAILTVGQMENIYAQYKAMNPQTQTESLYMEYETLKVVRHLFDMWQTDMIFKFDSYHNYVSTDTILVEKYAANIKDAAEISAEAMFLRHSIKMIICYKMLVDRLENTGADELLQQLAISHGLFGVAGEDFKVMDLHLTKYLLQRNLINDESIISLVAFLSLMSDKMNSIMHERRKKARTSYVSKMGLVGRTNVTRDNYRCMKRWSQTVSLINTKADIIQKQIKLHQPADKPESDNDTVDTETLKWKDFILTKLKIFRKCKDK